MYWDLGLYQHNNSSNNNSSNSNSNEQTNIEMRTHFEHDDIETHYGWILINNRFLLILMCFLNIRIYWFSLFIHNRAVGDLNCT